MLLPTITQMAPLLGLLPSALAYPPHKIEPQAATTFATVIANTTAIPTQNHLSNRGPIESEFRCYLSHARDRNMPVTRMNARKECWQDKVYKEDPQEWFTTCSDGTYFHADLRAYKSLHECQGYCNVCISFALERNIAAAECWHDAGFGAHCATGYVKASGDTEAHNLKEDLRSYVFKGRDFSGDWFDQEIHDVDDPWQYPKFPNQGSTA